MKKWISSKQKHLILWAILLVYLGTANQLYVNFVLDKGKPANRDIQLPAVSRSIVYKLADFQPARYDGQDYYELKGFAFNEANPPQEYQISIILSAGTHNLSFGTSSVVHPNMIESYPNYMPAMSRAEFRMLLSKNALQPGTYRVGILLEEKKGTNRYYVATGSTIRKTANTITYKAAP